MGKAARRVASAASPSGECRRPAAPLAWMGSATLPHGAARRRWLQGTLNHVLPLRSRRPGAAVPALPLMDYQPSFDAWLAQVSKGIVLPETVRILARMAYFAGADDALQRVASLTYETDPAYVPQHGGHEAQESRAENQLRGRVLVDAARQCRVDNLRRYRD